MLKIENKVCPDALEAFALKAIVAWNEEIKKLRTRVSSTKVVREDAKRKYDEAEAKHKTLAEELTSRETSQPEQKPFFVQTKNTLTGILCFGALEGN